MPQMARTPYLILCQPCGWNGLPFSHAHSALIADVTGHESGMTLIVNLGPSSCNLPPPVIRRIV